MIMMTGIMSKANILVCVIMAAQFAIAPFAGMFFSEIEGIIPEGMMMAALLAGNQLVCVLIPMLIFTVLAVKTDGVKIKELLSIKPVSLKNMALIVGMSFFIQPIIGVISVISQVFFTNNMGVIAETAVGEMPYPLMLGTFAVVPSVVEELALRGAVLGSYRREINLRRAVLINGLFFGMIHLDGQQFLYAAVLGAFFSFLVISTGSIFAAIAAHFTINATQVTLAYILVEMYGAIERELEKALGEPVSGLIFETVRANGQGGAFSEISGAEGIPGIVSFLSVLMAAGLIFGAYAVFMRLFAAFVKNNKSGELFSDEAESIDHLEDSRDFRGIPPINGEPIEIIFLKIRLKSREALEKTFYLSLALSLLTYFIIMLITNFGISQALYLIVVFATFFSGFFFLRIGS